MSEQKHTPGPWTVSHESGYIGTAGGTICIMYRPADRSGRGHTATAQEANARLIALAPELWDSLGWIVEFCNEHPEWFGAGDENAENEWLDSARALLSRLNP